MAAAPTSRTTLHIKPPDGFSTRGEASSVAKRWKDWLAAFEIYLDVANVETDSRKRALLLHTAGLEVQEICRGMPSSSASATYAGVTVEREEIVADCGVPSLPEIGTIVSACVTHVNSPSQLYIFFPHGISDLRVAEDVHEENQENFAALFEAMREHYKNSPRTVRTTLPACGELLVHCRAASGGAECLRVRVLEVNDQCEIPKVKVLFLDVGNIAWVGEDQLQPLAIQFSHMPPQAIESWLVGVDSDARWNTKAATFLKEITDDRILVGYVDEVHRESHRIGIHLFSTEDGDLDINAAVQEYVERRKQLLSCPRNSSEYK